MPLLRALVGIQIMLFILLPPAALAVAAGSEQWLLAGIPWVLFCGFLNGWVRARGLATYEEEKFLPIVRIGGKDSFHLAMLKVNASAGAVLVVALYLRGHL